MSTDVQSGIANLLVQLQILNRRLQTILVGSRGVGPTVGKEILGEAVGAIAEELFESSRVGDLGYSLTKKWAAQKNAEQLQSQRASIEYEYKQIASQALDLLSKVSLDSASIKPPGNSDQLVRKLRRITSYVKTDTKVLRTIQFLQSLQHETLVLDSEIPEVVAARKPGYQEAYGLLRELEGNMRKLLEKTLSQASANWWNDRIPDDVRQRAEERRKQARGSAHPINFVDFPDYLKIIRKRDNWRDYFHQFFKDEESISVKLRELEPIRNAIAHSRPLPKGSLDRLRVNARDILCQIG